MILKAALLVAMVMVATAEPKADPEDWEYLNKIIELESQGVFDDKVSLHKVIRDAYTENAKRIEKDREDLRNIFKLETAEILDAFGYKVFLQNVRRYADREDLGKIIKLEAAYDRLASRDTRSGLLADLLETIIAKISEL